MGLHAGFHHVVLNLIFRSEYMYQVVTSATQQNFCTGGGGGGVCQPPPPTVLPPPRGSSPNPFIHHF